MPDNWIDQHEGAEAVARPMFRDELRATLRESWDGDATEMVRVVPVAAPGRRWGRGVIAAGLVAASVIAGLIVLRRDSSPATVHTPPRPTTPPSTTTATHDGLRSAIVDSRWAIIAVDGSFPRSRYVPWFKLSDDGTLVGDDGCNDYGVDLNSGSRWVVSGDTITPPAELGSTAVLCPGATVNPFAAPITVGLLDPNTITLDAARYTAIRLDPASGVPAADVVGDWVWQGATATIDAGGSVSGLDNGTESSAEFFRYNSDVLVVKGSFIFLLTRPPAPDTAFDLTIYTHQLTPLSPQPMATIPWGDGDGQLGLLNAEFGTTAAVLPDGQVLVLDQPGSDTLTGRAVRSDGSTFFIEGIAGLHIAWIAASPNGMLFLALGGPEGGPHIVGFRLEGNTYVKVATSEFPILGDAPILLIAEGVQWSDRLMLAIGTGLGGRQPTVQWDRTSPQPGDGGAQGTVVRTAADGTQRRWTMRADLSVDTLGPGASFWDLGRDVLISGPADDSYHRQFIGLLSSDGASAAFDSAGWQVIGTHDDKALVALVTTEGVRIGWFPASPPLDFARYAVYGVQPAMSAGRAIEVISAALGEPDTDTGWTLSVGCTSRLVRWRNLSMSFAGNDDSNSSLLGWSIGDPRAGWSERDGPPITATEIADLRTADGIGVGSSYADFASAYITEESHWGTDPITGGTMHYRFGAVVMNVIEQGGTITGIGSAVPDC